jgi:hypothetical protein
VTLRFGISTLWRFVATGVADFHSSRPLRCAAIADAQFMRLALRLARRGCVGWMISSSAPVNQKTGPGNPATKGIVEPDSSKSETPKEMSVK